ncbi:MAG: hypothetical protein RH860_08970 [Cytophagales bacterium]
MPAPDQNPNINEVLKAYQNIFPEFSFPTDFPEARKIETLKNSRGRKIIFSKQKDGYRVFFEDNDSQTVDSPKWNRLIGCGG